ncbi:T cell receptor beta chain MC.7.G5-like [Pseudoliparis swirei]|uniref:T cell receptor beta chain MC.7.G5-like n=1 Tax=Pseudoliparis swirei TaxID=2059687 RepID=UPI0024BD7A79|nr:T cell receptor beta chain MC.7.G5-like [Pseudoliparis swirei]
MNPNVKQVQSQRTWHYQDRRGAAEIEQYEASYWGPDADNQGQHYNSRRKAETRSGPRSLRADYNAAYFGQGTKLTVLEPGHDVSGPTVKVLRPSPKECQSHGDQEKKKTIVCVASGFYPDHVGVLWKVDGVEVTTGVATDSAALRHGKSYRISSRLRVSAKDWFTDHKEFTCSVRFFNGTHTELYSHSILGGKGTLHLRHTTHPSMFSLHQQ